MADTEIEKERRKRLQENMDRMNTMGLATSAQLAREQSSNAKKLTHKPRAQQHPISSPHTPDDQAMRRQSSRVKLLPPPTYTPCDFLLEDGDRRKKRTLSSTGMRGRRGEGSGGQSRVSNTDGWQTSFGVASPRAASDARAAALRLIADIKRSEKACVTGLKDMSESQVSGGFWCQLPKQFASTFDLSAKYKISLLMGDDEDDATEVVFLPRKGGSGGLSGGWRTFAIEKKLYPNDTVVFQKISDVKVKAHVFRAYNYDEDFEVGEAPVDNGDREVVLRRQRGSGGLKRQRGAKTPSSEDSDDEEDEDNIEMGQSEEELEKENDDDEEEEEEEEEEETTGDVYEVDKIIGYCPAPSLSLAKRPKGPVFTEEMFKIRWRGYSAEDDTWEPRSSLVLPPHTYIWEGVKMPLHLLDKR